LLRLSLARTEKVWPPVTTIYDVGDVHAVQLSPSSLHSNLAFDSVDVNENVAVARSV
jgi:hypothetical protein